MMTTSTITWIIVALIATGLIVIFNRLVRKRNYCFNSFAQIDVQLAKRHDLVPNLVKVAQRYLEHEQTVLENVIESRKRASESLVASREDIGSLATIQLLMRSEASFGQALHGFFANVEAYPDLKGSEQMKLLHNELVHIENCIAYARQAYNDSVTFYNIDRESFPSSVVAQMFGFKPMAQLELDVGDEAPKVFR